MSATRWGHSTSSNPECWSGSFRTKQEAIADGKADYGEGFFVKSGSRLDPYQAMPKARELFERMGDFAYDNWSALDGFPDVSASAEAELDALLKAWCGKHLADVEVWLDDGLPAERVELTPEEIAEQARKDQAHVAFHEGEDTEPSGPGP